MTARLSIKELADYLNTLKIYQDLKFFPSMMHGDEFLNEKIDADFGCVFRLGIEPVKRQDGRSFLETICFRFLLKYHRKAVNIKNTNQIEIRNNNFDVYDLVIQPFFLFLKTLNTDENIWAKYEFKKEESDIVGDRFSTDIIIAQYFAECNKKNTLQNEAMGISNFEINLRGN